MNSLGLQRKKDGSLINSRIEFQKKIMHVKYVASFPVTLITLSPPLAKFFRLRFIF